MSYSVIDGLVGYQFWHDAAPVFSKIMVTDDIGHCWHINNAFEMFVDTQQPDCGFEDALWHAATAEQYRCCKRFVLLY